MRNHITPWEDDAPEAILWTDDYSNLASVLSSESGTEFLFDRLIQYIRQGVESRYLPVLPRLLGGHSERPRECQEAFADARRAKEDGEATFDKEVSN